VGWDENGVGAAMGETCCGARGDGVYVDERDALRRDGGSCGVRLAMDGLLVGPLIVLESQSKRRFGAAR